jgi:hypothetical protein
MMAAERCDGCGRAICGACAVFVGMVPRCVSCARQSAQRRRRSSLRLQVALVIAVWAASLGLGVVLGLADVL